VGGFRAALFAFGYCFAFYQLTSRTREVWSHTGDALYDTLRWRTLLRNSNSSTEFRDCAPIRILKRVFSPRVDLPARGFLLSGPPFSSTKVAPLDNEIAADFLVVEHMRLFGGVAHLFDRDRIKVGEKGFARPAHGGLDDPLKQHRMCAEVVRIGGAQ
jgi:hypothetical protein